MVVISKKAMKCTYFERKCAMLEQKGTIFWITPKLVRNNYWISYSKGNAGRCYQWPPFLIITFQQHLLYILILYFHVFRRVWQCWKKLEQTSKPQPGNEIFKYKVVKWAWGKLNRHRIYASIWIVTGRNQMCQCVSLWISISSQYLWIPHLLKTTLRIHMCPWPPHRSAALMWLQTDTYPWAPPPCPSPYSPMAKQSCLRLPILTLSLLQSTATLNQEHGVNVSGLKCKVYQYYKT